MEAKEKFSPQEWQQVLSLPVYCAALIITGDLSALPGLIEESQALYQMLDETREHQQDGELARAAAEMLLSRQTENERQTMLQALQFGDSQEMLAETRGVVALINSRVDQEARRAYYHWTYELAVEVAEAAREGGFLGLGGVAVSPEEQALLDRLVSVLQIDPGYDRL